ncbi:S1/P1 nuclease [Aliiglaciecola sp. CAU 1673]|uniref:S1/P1 nuclease n=1 Tax=Aliiglaciecola sp. CAU 1673 TaxID=3032595 RepID=UPI0023DB1320|nr:S1/P1 nuclease [Aliiglaciecola sp. CAU 1673]MDF2177166.1 S1/P1 nuclease [Aliiglaciecola sp. CAU 1673]
MRKCSSKLVVGVLALLVSANVFAWGQTGHNLVAAIAYEHLTPEVRTKVDALLAHKGFKNLGSAANWPDVLRDTKAIGYEHTGPWHFVNLPRDALNFDRARDCVKPCIVSALEDMIKQLQDPDPDKQFEALAFVSHLVGDIHQPLHVSYAFDRGGNDYQVKVDEEMINLHHYWDTVVLRGAGTEENMLSRLSARVNASNQQSWQQWQVASVNQWINESYDITRRIYVGKVSKISNARQRQDQKLALERIKQAGVRLAHLLNNQLSKP